MVKKMLLGLTLLGLLVILAPVLAQDSPLASGLNNPRHIVYDSDGTLYIAEAGTGGDLDGEGPYGPVKMGLTAQISAVAADAKQSVLIPNLVSMDAAGQIEGATSLYVTDNSYWVVLGMGPKNPPDGTQVMAVVEYDRQAMTVKQVIDLSAFETQNNPDEGEERISNPIDIAVGKDGTLYIADASGNSLLSWTEKDGLKLVAAWKVDKTGQTPQSVPTAVVIGPDGDIYVSFLSGFPFPPGGARIERWSADGKLKETYKGLTLVTDITVTDDGAIYAVEMAKELGQTGFTPNSGRIIQIKDDNLGIVAEGLNLPYGIAQAPDGKLAVTVDSTFVAPNSGKVIAVTIGEIKPMEAIPATTPEAQPATTPEAQPATTPEAQSGGKGGDDKGGGDSSGKGGDDKGGGDNSGKGGDDKGGGG